MTQRNKRKIDDILKDFYHKQATNQSPYKNIDDVEMFSDTESASDKSIHSIIDVEMPISPVSPTLSINDLQKQPFGLL